MPETKTCPRCNGEGTVEVGMGDRFKDLRVARGLTQLQLATAAGMERPRLGNIESDHRNPTLQEIIAIAKGLNISTDYLLGVQSNA